MCKCGTQRCALLTTSGARAVRRQRGLRGGGYKGGDAAGVCKLGAVPGVSNAWDGASRATAQRLARRMEVLAPDFLALCCGGGTRSCRALVSLRSRNAGGSDVERRVKRRWEVESRRIAGELSIVGAGGSSGHWTGWTTRWNSKALQWIEAGREQYSR